MAFISSRKSFLKSATLGDIDELKYCLTYMIPVKFELDTRDTSGRTAAYLAAANGQLEALKELIAAKADLNIADNDGVTPLIAAARAAQPAAARLLITAGADVNAHDNNYVPAIIAAGRYGLLDVIQDLVNGGADINAVSNTSGRTTLHWAVEGGFGPVVEYLVSKNARTDILDRDGKSPLDLAQANGGRMAKLMERSKAVTTAAVTPPANDGDSWTLMGAFRVAHIAAYPSAGRKITEIFNFENRERVTIAENLSTGAESMTQPEKFEALSEDILGRAEEQLRALGGSVPEKLQKKAFNL